MAKHVTRWSPDTCGCVLAYEWDDAMPEGARVHTPTEIVVACPVHPFGPGSGTTGHFAKVLEENQRKNRALGMIKDRRADLTDADLTWSFDSNRNVVIDAPKLTGAERADLQRQADQDHGPGKVRIR